MEQPVTRKRTILNQSVKARVAGRTAMPKQASKTARGDTIQKRRPVKTRLVGSKNPSAATTAMVREITPDIATKLKQRETILVGSPDVNQHSGLTWRAIVVWLAAASSWLRKQFGSRRSRKRLRVCETVSLGDKRFVAVIEVDGEQFLVGGASNSVATLARLARSPEFSEVLRQRWAQDPIQA